MGLYDRLFGSSDRLDAALEAASSPERRYAHGVEVGKIRPGATFGRDGRSFYEDTYPGGYDSNVLLSGRQKYDVFEEMRHDPAVRSALWMYKLPIRQAMWTFEPPPEPIPLEEEAAEACRWQFGLEGYDGEMIQTWDQSLSQGLLYIDWGAMGEEIIWGDMAVFVPKEGSGARPLRTIVRLAPRAPRTISDFEVDERTGQIKRILQDIPNADWIPGYKLAWYVLEREGASIFGTSMLRAMYGPWKLKVELLRANAIAWDRWASGIPKVRYPHGGGPDKEKRATDLGAHLRTHERAYAALEGTAEHGWDVEIIQGTIQDATPMLRYYDEQIALGALQMMKMLGGTPYGSRAGAEALADPYYLAAVAIADEIAAERRRQVISRFVRVNFGEGVRPPVLNVSKIQAKNIPVLARALADFSAAGLTFTDRDTQNDIRDQLDLARLPEDVAVAIDDLPDDVGLEPAVPPKELPKPAGEGEGLAA